MRKDLHSREVNPPQIWQVLNAHTSLSLQPHFNQTAGQPWWRASGSASFSDIQLLLVGLSSNILSRCVCVFLWHFWGRVTESGLPRIGFPDSWCTFHCTGASVCDYVSSNANSIKNPPPCPPSCLSTIWIQLSAPTEPHFCTRWGVG